jgi:hypothetical protein
MINELPMIFDPHSEMGKKLCEEFGAENVETVLICIVQQRDRKGMHVSIPPTYEMARTILEAMHSSPKGESEKS